MRGAWNRKGCDGHIRPGLPGPCTVCEQHRQTIALCTRCLALQCLRCFDALEGCGLGKVGE